MNGDKKIATYFEHSMANGSDMQRIHHGKSMKMEMV